MATGIRSNLQKNKAEFKDRLKFVKSFSEPKTIGILVS
jgi:hypothetical protein